MTKWKGDIITYKAHLRKKVLDEKAARQNATGKPWTTSSIGRSLVRISQLSTYFDAEIWNENDENSLEIEKQPNFNIFFKIIIIIN